MNCTPVTDEWLRQVVESRPRVGSARFYAVYEELLERREAEAAARKAERKTEALAHKVKAEETPVLPGWAYERAANDKFYVTPSLPSDFHSNGTVFVNMAVHVIESNDVTKASLNFPVVVTYKEASQAFYRQQASEAIESMPF